VWSAHRASATPTSSSLHSTQQGKDPPPKLNSEGAKTLRQVQEQVVKMLVNKLIDTSVYGDDTSTSSSTQVRANEQNVMNRGREDKFLTRIERYVHAVDLITCKVADGFCRSKAEDQAWVEVSQFYNSYKENSESALKRQPLLSTKSKGKQRATDAEIWSTVGRELPAQFQGKRGVDMALRLIDEASTCAGSSTKLKEKLASMELKVCSIRFSTRSFTLHVPMCSWRISTSELGRHLNARARLRMNWIGVLRTSTSPSPQQTSYRRYPTIPSHQDCCIYHTLLTRTRL